MRLHDHWRTVLQAGSFMCVLAACTPMPKVVAQDADAVFSAMDRVYERFTRAYRLTEPDSVMRLYTERPLYLPGQGAVLQGRAAVRAQFQFLEQHKARGSIPHISFESVERGTSGELAWDVGYYTIVVEAAPGRRAPPTRGKFALIWKRNESGEWLIHVDSFSPAPPPGE